MNVRNGNELPMNTLFFDNTVGTVTDDERRRVLKRGTYTDSGLNGEQQVTIGPSCVELYPLLAADDYPYNTESPLATLELREMMASTTLAVLNDAEKYTTIVGEDTSGRIPALVIGKAVNIVRQRSGLPKARRLFISGAIDNDQVPGFAAEAADKATLLITEYIVSGGSARKALGGLARAGFQHSSVATLDRYDWGNHHIPVVDFYMGDRTTYTARADAFLHGPFVEEFKGVAKLRGEAHAHRQTPQFYGDHDKLIALRNDIDHFASYLVAMWDVLNSQ